MALALLPSTFLRLQNAWADSVIATIPVGTFPQNLAFDSDNGDMYVTNLVSETVSVIDGSTNTVVKTIDVGRGPQGVAFDSSNGNMYVANGVSNTVSVIDGLYEYGG
jgi:YVTN family beta-propeller protein